MAQYNAVTDPDTGKFYHPDCAPDLAQLDDIEVDGMVCEGCGAIIESEEEEDTGDTRTIDPEEED